LTVEETAELLHVGRDNVYYLLRTSQLHGIKIGKLRRIPPGADYEHSVPQNAPKTCGQRAVKRS
jgi:excisionase family DNA binding protein